MATTTLLLINRRGDYSKASVRVLSPVLRERLKTMGYTIVQTVPNKEK